MKTIFNALNNLKNISQNCMINSKIHSLNPVVKVIITIIYIICVVSYGMYSIVPLIPYLVFIYFVTIASNLSFKNLIKNMYPIFPVLIVLAISSSIFNDTTFVLFGKNISGAIVLFISIMLKTTLSVFSIIVLMSVTKSTDVFNSLTFFRVNKTFVTVLFLIYRYLFLFLEDILNVYISYNLRSHNKNGIKVSDLGSILGQSIIRCYDRAGVLYSAMLLRGYDKAFALEKRPTLSRKDIFQILIIGLLLISFKVFNPIYIVGGLFL